MAIAWGRRRSGIKCSCQTKRLCRRSSKRGRAKKKRRPLRKRRSLSRRRAVPPAVVPTSGADQSRLPTVSVRPIVQRYFYLPADDIPLTEELVIPATRFVDDRGEPAESFPDHRQEGYFNLYVNGVLQEGQLFRVDSRSVSVASTGQKILAGTPIILESVGFIAKVF